MTVATLSPPRSRHADRVGLPCDCDDNILIADRLQRLGRKRIIFADGWMELHMSRLHQQLLNRLVALLMMTAASVFGLYRRAGGSTTFRRVSRQKGAKPDSRLWIAHAEAVRGRSQFDAKAGPPPDLNVEVDLAAGSDARMSGWIALVVPEVCRVLGDGSVRYCRLVEGAIQGLGDQPALFATPAAAAHAVPANVARDQIHTEIEQQLRVSLTEQQ